jgi:quinoprotein glucose dehydrogenase
MKFPIRLGRTEAVAVVIFALVFTLISGACGSAQAQTRPAGDHGSGTEISLDWPVYGGQAAGDHYSSLSQINRKNVQTLQVAWKFDAGEEGGLETSPIIVGRVLYA